MTDTQATAERAFLGEVTCCHCKNVWAALIPEIAEPPYECSRCGKDGGYCSPTWKLYCSVEESSNSATIWVDGFSKTFQGKTLMECTIAFKQAFEAMLAGDTSLFER